MSEYDALGYYQILGVSPNAPLLVIKQQYYEQAKFWHPDHNNAIESQDMFQRLSTAYDILQNEHKRLVYDLLSAVYSDSDFPQIGALRVYKNQKDKDDKALRVLKQHHVICAKVSETKDICNIYEASDMVVTTSVRNWLQGWWGKNGFANTKNALKHNLQAVNDNDMDNLKLLVHNAIAYEQENNSEMAWIYAMQADRMAIDGTYFKVRLRQFIEGLNYQPQEAVEIPYWDAQLLQKRQRIFPLGVLTILFSLIAMFGLYLVLTGTKPSEVGYYEERVFADGTRMPTDTIVNKIIKTDSSPTDDKYLMNFKQTCTIYHGPDERYSPMQEAKQNQTIRVSGYTADKTWYQIIIDNGEAGYARVECLQKGIGLPVPLGSKVYVRKKRM